MAQLDAFLLAMVYANHRVFTGNIWDYDFLEGDITISYRGEVGSQHSTELKRDRSGNLRTQEQMGCLFNLLI